MINMVQVSVQIIVMKWNNIKKESIAFNMFKGFE